MSVSMEFVIYIYNIYGSFIMDTRVFNMREWQFGNDRQCGCRWILDDGTHFKLIGALKLFVVRVAGNPRYTLVSKSYQICLRSSTTDEGVSRWSCQSAATKRLSTRLPEFETQPVLEIKAVLAPYSIMMTKNTCLLKTPLERRSICMLFFTTADAVHGGWQQVAARLNLKFYHWILFGRTDDLWIPGIDSNCTRLRIDDVYWGWVLQYDPLMETTEALNHNPGHLSSIANQIDPQRARLYGRGS